MDYLITCSRLVGGMDLYGGPVERDSNKSLKKVR